jgi:hypothetical protein
MGTEAENRQAFRIQEHYCRTMDAPRYAAICAAVAQGLTRTTEVGRRLLDWPGEPTKDALPLRFIGGLHALVLADADAGLARLFREDMPTMRSCQSSNACWRSTRRRCSRGSTGRPRPTSRAVPPR